MPIQRRLWRWPLRRWPGHYCVIHWEEENFSWLCQHVSWRTINLTLERQRRLDWDAPVSPITFKGVTANSELFVLGAGSGSPYTVTLGQALIAAGAVDITSANATLSIGTGDRLHAAPSALTGENGAGGTLAVSAGVVALSGGTVEFYQTSVTGGPISGFGATDLARAATPASITS